MPQLALPPRSPFPDVDCRDLRLDFCRGLALWFVFLDHVPDNSLSWLTLRSYGFSDTTEVFFFVSGYTCMIAYGTGLHGLGWPATIARAFQRAWEIYVAFLLLVLVYLALVQLLGSHNYLDETNTGPFFTNPGAAVIRTLLLQYMPVNTDVLPTFVLLHLAFPAALFLLNRAPSVALAGSVLLYVAARQLGWNLASWPHGEWYFNPLAWQALFVIGAWYATPGATRLKPLLQSKVAMAIAALYLAFGLVVALSWQFHGLEVLLPQAMVQLLYPIDKSSLSPWRLFHFLALAVIIARVLRRDWHGLTVRGFKAIIRCGENSLPIYCLSVLLSFLGHVVLNQISNGFPMQVVVSFLGISIMISAATLMTWTAKLDRRGPKLF